MRALSCTFCGDATRFRITARAELAICDRCVGLAGSGLADHGTDLPCSFCRTAAGLPQYRTKNAIICAPCVELCVEIIAEERPVPLPAARVIKH